MIIFILLLGLFLRLLAGYHKDFWFDEAISYLIAKQNFKNLVLAGLAENHPPLYFWLLHFWLKINQTVFFLRLPSLCFGVITIFFVYKITSVLTDQKTAQFSALIFALSPLHVYFSAETRMYNLWTMLILASLYYFLIYLHSPKFSLLFIHYFLLLLSLLTHFSTFFFILSLDVYLCFTKKKLLKSFIFGQLIITILILPLLLLYLKISPSRSYSLPLLIGLPTTFVSFVLGGMSEYTLKSYFSLSVPILIKLIFSLAFLLISFFSFTGFKKSTYKIKILAFSLIFYPIGVLSIINFFKPVYYSRLLVPFSFGFLFLSAYAIARSKKHFLVLVTLVSLLSATILQSIYPCFKKQSLSKAVTLIKKSGPGLITHQHILTFYPFLFYLPQEKHLLLADHSLSTITTEIIGGKKTNLKSIINQNVPFYRLGYTWSHQPWLSPKENLELNKSFLIKPLKSFDDLEILYCQPK